MDVTGRALMASKLKPEYEKLNKQAQEEGRKKGAEKVGRSKDGKFSRSRQDLGESGRDCKKEHDKTTDARAAKSVGISRETLR